ncbi:MAG: biopolymer transporter ExbD [Bradyrhizobium sp.]|nr:MAG: biopolymer transporter ExbD [Bradyrhizobium sp.]
MAVSVGAARKSGRGRRGVPRYGAMADINMTPFIDVMLVLLIIFMVAAPLLTSGVPIDLPQAKAGALNVDQKPIALSINDQGQLFVMDQPVADADLAAKLQSLSGGSNDQRIFLRASKTVAYGRVAEIMGVVTTAGFKKVALVTEPDNKP